MSIGARAIGTGAIGAGLHNASSKTRRHTYSSSGAIGTFAIGAGDIGGVRTSFLSASGAVDPLPLWRRRGRR